MDDLMKNAKVSKAVAKMAIPSVISNLVTVVYNMADTFFVGQTKDALQVAAVSLTNPIFILLMAFANMFGMGGSAVISMALGENREDKVKQVSANVFYLSLLIGAIIGALLLIFPKQILGVFGANAQTYDYAYSYTFWIALGAPFIVLSAAASFIVRGEGHSTEAMIGNMIGTFANIILDPIFISVFHMGAGGAALATTLGNMMASAYYLYYFLAKSSHMSIGIRYCKINKLTLNVCNIGLPTAIFSALMSVSTIVLNQILVAYGNSAVAAIGIVFKANMFITFFQQGIANGVAPLLGYAYGASDGAKFKEIRNYTLKTLIISGVICTALYFIFRKQIIQIFINDPKVIAYGVPMLVAYMLSGPFIGILFLNMTCMQSVGHAMPATILSICRQGLILIPLFYILNALFKLNGVILGQSITDLITIVLSIFLWRHMSQHIFEKA